MYLVAWSLNESEDGVNLVLITMNGSDRMWCKVLMFQPIYHVSISPTDGNGPTQGQRKTLTKVGFEPTTFEFDHRCSTDWATRSDGSRSWEMKMLMAQQWICRYKERLRCISNGHVLLMHALLMQCYVALATQRPCVANACVANAMLRCISNAWRLLMQRNLSLYLHIHCRAINIFISHDLLPSDLVAQSVEQWWSNLKVVGSNPTLVRVFLCPCVGPFPSVGLTLTWYMGWNISTLHHILSLPFILNISATRPCVANAT